MFKKIRALTDEEIMQQTVQLIRQNVGDDVEVFLIGSRATKTHSPRSDFDFVFDAKTERCKHTK